MKEINMSVDEMISNLDGAAGRLLVPLMKDETIREAMEMITKVSLALGEVAEIKFYDYENDLVEEDL